MEADAAVDLKACILARAGMKTLRAIARVLPAIAEPAALRSKAGLCRALADEPLAGTAFLLSHLSAAELREVAQARGVPASPDRARLTADLLRTEHAPPVRVLERRRRTFVAIDFETADYYRDSACALALVRVEGEQIVDRQCFLIRPPRRQFAFTHLHGITWEDVARQPSFSQLWPRLYPLLRGVDFLAAHNAPFDRSVMRACCEVAGVAMPATPFLCTVRLSRQVWKLTQAKLPDVCRHLRIDLRHHHAASDAEACARIVLSAAAEQGPPRFDYHERHPALLPS